MTAKEFLKSKGYDENITPIIYEYVNHIKMLENNKRSKKERIKSIADALGIDILLYDKYYDENVKIRIGYWKPMPVHFLAILEMVFGKGCIEEDIYEDEDDGYVYNKYLYILKK